jgi:protoheme IX farnesyltransferase
LFLLLFLWQIPHFLSISLRYADDYSQAGIKVYPNTLGLRPTQWRMFWFCVLLCLLGVVPYLAGTPLPAIYLKGTIILSLVFLFLSAIGFFIKTTNTVDVLKWSKLMFWGSLFYLPIQLFWLYYHY